jgi:hypothetical protein
MSANDVSQQMLFFTDEEPPQDQMGSPRHFFGRPSLKGYKQNPFRAQSPGILKEEVILSNPEAQSVLRRIAELEQQVKLDLEGKFRLFDTQGTGMIKKADFINVVFETVKMSGGSIQASEILNLMNLFTTSFDEVINYDDFLRLL